MFPWATKSDRREELNAFEGNQSATAVMDVFPQQETNFPSGFGPKEKPTDRKRNLGQRRMSLSNTLPMAGPMMTRWFNTSIGYQRNVRENQ
jgi:hypothetical protein